MAIRWNKGSGGDDLRPPDIVEVGYRRCKVCEWEGQMILRSGEDPDCPWCHAPTEPTAEPAVTPDPDAPVRQKNPHAAALGRLGGLKGGRARAKALTPSQRTRIATRAARARWDKPDDTAHKRASGEKDNPREKATEKVEDEKKDDDK